MPPKRAKKRKTGGKDGKKKKKPDGKKKLDLSVLLGGYKDLMELQLLEVRIKSAAERKRQLVVQKNTLIEDLADAKKELGQLYLRDAREQEIIHRLFVENAKEESINHTILETGVEKLRTALNRTNERIKLLDTMRAVESAESALERLRAAISTHEEIEIGVGSTVGAINHLKHELAQRPGFRVVQCDYMIPPNVVAIILEVMAQSPRAVDIQLEGLTALGALGRHDMMNDMGSIENHGLEHILHAMDTHAGHEPLQHKACQYLYRLMTTPRFPIDVCEAMIGAGIIQRILRTVTPGWRKSSRLQQVSISILERLLSAGDVPALKRDYMTEQKKSVRGTVEGKSSVASTTAESIDEIATNVSKARRNSRLKWMMGGKQIACGSDVIPVKPKILARMSELCCGCTFAWKDENMAGQACRALTVLLDESLAWQSSFIVPDVISFFLSCMKKFPQTRNIHRDASIVMCRLLTSPEAPLLVTSELQKQAQASKKEFATCVEVNSLAQLISVVEDDI